MVMSIVNLAASVSDEVVINKIFLIRGENVMLDMTLQIYSGLKPDV